MSKFSINEHSNRALPDASLTTEELKSLIKKSEKSIFFPIKDLKKSISKWKSKAGK